MSGLILITRPRPEADAYAVELSEEGFETFVEPMLEYHPLDFVLPDLSQYDGLLLTSAQALAALFSKYSVAHARGFEGVVYCVGQHTAKEARAYGFSHCVSVDGTGQDLAVHIQDLPEAGSQKYVHIRGKDVAYPVAETLHEKGIDAQDLIVYEVRSVEAFSDAFKKVFVRGNIGLVTFYSKRTAQAFMHLVRKNGFEDKLSAIKLLSISERVLECVRIEDWAKTYVSGTPDRAGMLKILKEIYQEKRSGDRMSKKGTAIDNAQDVIEAFGGIRPMAKKMDVAVTTVQGWKKRNAIPAARIDDVYKAAEDHGIDLSSILDGGSIANQNGQAEVSSSAPAQSSSLSAGDTKIGEARSGEEEAKVRAEDVELVALKRQISDIEKQAVAKSTGVSAALVVALLIIGAVVLGYFLWPKLDFKQAETQRLQVLEQELSQVKKEQSFLGTLVPENLERQIADLQEKATQAQQNAQAVAEQVKERAAVIQQDVLAEDAGTMEERLEKLEGHAQVIADDLQDAPAVVAMLERVQQWQGHLAGQEYLQDSMNALQGALAGVEIPVDGSASAINNALDAARAQNEVLAKTFEGVPQSELKAAALLLGMSQLRSSLNRDNEVFQQDLDILLKLVGNEDPLLNEALVKLAPNAQSGVLTPEGLSNEFRTLAGDAVAASLQGEDVSIKERASARFNELLQVEKDGELVTGTPTQATLLKTQNLLEQGDIHGAIANTQMLEGGAAQVMAPWLEEAQASVIAEQVKVLLSQTINAKVNTMSGITAGGLKPAGARGSQYIQDEESGLNVYVPNKAPAAIMGPPVQ